MSCINATVGSAITEHLNASLGVTCAVGRYLELSRYEVILAESPSTEIVEVITNCLWSVPDSVPWLDGGGSLSVEAAGKYDGRISFGSAGNDWLDRSLGVAVAANYAEQSKTVKVTQLGTREEVMLADGSILELSTGRLGILKTRR